MTNEQEKRPEYWVGYLGETLAQVAEGDEPEAREVARRTLKDILRSRFNLTTRLRMRFTSAIIDPPSSNGGWHEPGREERHE